MSRPDGAGDEALGGPFQDVLIRWLSAQEMTIYLVGGCVRDRLLGRVSHDLDVAVDGDPIRLGRRLADQFGGAFYVLDADRDVGRVLLPYDKEMSFTLDLTRLAGGDIGADLAARDFTINAMALPVRAGGVGDIVDPYGGRHDLELGRLRIVSPTALRDDPIRALRAVRMIFKFRLQVDAEMESSIRESALLLGRVSPERIRDELCQIFSLSPAAAPIAYLNETGILFHLLGLFGPENDGERQKASRPARAVALIDAWEQLLDKPVGSLARPTTRLLQVFRRAISPYQEGLQQKLQQTVSDQRTQDLLVKWLMVWLHVGGKDNLETILSRLHLSNVEVRRAKTMAHVFTLPDAWVEQRTVSRKQLYRFYREAGDCGPESLLLYLADRLAALERGESLHSPEVMAHLIEQAWRAYFDAYETVVSPPPLIDGHLVMSHFGLPSGPSIGRLLEMVREAQAEGELETPEQALRWLERNLPAQS